MVALTALTACGGGEEEPEVVETPVAEPAEPAGGMEGMQGMGGAADAEQTGLPPELQAHMRMMQSASGDELARMVPEHRQLVANMIAQMNREMRDMNMTTDTEWDETVQALRDDLVRLPEMTGDELQTFLPEHQARIERLAEMHRSMMGDMQM